MAAGAPTRGSWAGEGESGGRELRRALCLIGLALAGGERGLRQWGGGSNWAGGKSFQVPSRESVGSEEYRLVRRHA